MSAISDAMRDNGCGGQASGIPDALVTDGLIYLDANKQIRLAGSGELLVGDPRIDNAAFKATLTLEAQFAPRRTKH